MRGLVLEGGGTKGAYQIGAYRALRELGIDFQGVTGTSIGALNGAYIVQNDIEIMEDIWLSYDYTHFMNVDEEFYEKYKDIDFTAKNINSVIGLINKAVRNEGIDITPLRELMQKTLNEDAIRNSGKDFGLITVYLDRKINPHPLHLEDIPQGRLVDYLIASASLPIFQLERMDDKLYLDGVFFDNMPVRLLEEKGYEDIVAIRLLSDYLGKANINKYKEKGMNIKVIEPSEYLGGSLNKDRCSVEKNINLGYFDTMKAYDRYYGVRYYFDEVHKFDEDYCFEIFRSVDKETIAILSNILNIKKEPTLRTLIEDIIPRLGELIGLKKDFSYKDLFYCIYEKKLEENNINRIKLYDFKKVIDVTNKNINPNTNPSEILDSSIGAKSIMSLQKNKRVKLLTNYLIRDFVKQSKD